MNPVGFGNLGFVGTFRGLGVIVDQNIPLTAGTGGDTPLILGSFRDALLFEDQAAPAQIALTYPDVLQTDVSVFGFSALAIRRPASFAAISGILAP